MESLVELFSRPEAWAALGTLIVMEVVLGIDNLLFISIVTAKLPPAQQPTARRIGIGLALVLRLLLLGAIAWIAGLTAIVFDLGIEGSPGLHGEPTFETAFSWRDLILIAGGLFLIYKATVEIRGKLTPGGADHHGVGSGKAAAAFGAVIFQIILLDVVFSIDSILTAIGMTEHLPIMVIAVVFAVGVMFFAAGPVARFVNNNPSVVILALAFLLMIGTVLVADGFGRHVPKGYIYAAMAFAVFVEALNMVARRRGPRASKKGPVPPATPTPGEEQVI